MTRRWSGKVYHGIPAVSVVVEDGKSFTVVVKARSVESGVEAQNSLGSAKCRRGRRKASSPPSREYISGVRGWNWHHRPKAERQSENHKGRQGRIPNQNQNQGTQHQDHTESEARMGYCRCCLDFPFSTTHKRRRR